MKGLIKNEDAARYNMGIVGVNLPDLPPDVPLEESPYAYHKWRNTPCFSYGDISHTMFPR